MDKKIIIGLSVAVAIVAVIGFVAWQLSKPKNTIGNQIGNADNFNRNRENAANNKDSQRAGGIKSDSNFSFVNGKIIEKDDTSITVEIKTGGSAIAFYSASTKVMKIVDASVSDLTVGQTITARGTKNSDGTISVSSAQIRPAADQQAQGAAPAGQTITERAAAAPAPSGQNSGFVMGQITAVNGNNVTVKSPSGNEQTITLSADAKISKLSDAQLGELAPGVEVMATGTKGTNGSITAQLIQIGDSNIMSGSGGRMEGRTGSGQATPAQN